MPITKEQFLTCLDLISPFMGDEAERKAFVTRSLWESSVLGQISWSGTADAFATNLVSVLHAHDDIAPLVTLLTDLRAKVGPGKQSEIDEFLRELDPDQFAPEPPPAPDPDIDPVEGVGTLFISYSREDADFVGRLRERLKAHGVDHWIDAEGLTAGTPSWERALREAIAVSSGVIWVVSPSSFASRYVRDEIALAEESFKRPLFPVWASGDNWRDVVPLGRSEIQYADMRGDAFEHGFAQLIEALRGASPELVIAPPEPPAPTETEPMNPYMGLRAFEGDDAHKFFGRTALTDRLVTRLHRQMQNSEPRFLAVVGPSGAGKSSVVMAGMIPALEHDALSAAWTYLPRMVPGTNPMSALAASLEAVMPAPPKKPIVGRLSVMGADYLDVLFDGFAGDHVVLYIDQFEELFTLTADEGERTRFISLITEAATDRKGKLIVILSMRADFFGAPLNYDALGPLIRDHNEAVLPMSIAELTEAIEGPARLPDAALVFDDGLSAEILFALRAWGSEHALSGALPLLQFTLERLFKARDGHRLTWDAYRAMKRVAGAIGTHSEAVFSGLPEAAQAQLGPVFVQLVSIDESSGEPTRRRAPLDAVTRTPEAKALVDAFVSPEARLLQAGRDGNTAYVEVAHEALLRSWPRLVNWIDATREDQLTIKRMEREAALWTERGKPEHMLPNAESIGEFESACARLGREVSNGVLRDFIEPEQARLLRELEELPPDATSHERRRDIGDRLAVIGDTRAGVGVVNGVPDVAWVSVAVSPDPVTIKTDENEIGPLTIQRFLMAKFQVTYAQFQAFVDAADGFNDDRWWEGMPDGYQKQSLSNQRTKIANSPRDSVSWYQSVAFARWMNQRLQGVEITHPDGVLRVGENAEIRLPTEWEWQWAAMNGNETREYPWQGGWQEGYANTSEAGLNRTTAVGMYLHGAAVCGALDMAGNLYDWCQNKHGTPEQTAVDGSGDSRVLRGGSFSYDRYNAAAAYRLNNVPNLGRDHYGLRLVVGVPISAL